MLHVGLTGGIASGKSAVSRRLAEHGAVIIDADQLAREVVDVGTEGLTQIVEEFGPEVLAADGSLDRPALGQRVFDNEESLRRLNAIIHPKVRAAAARKREAAPEGSVVVEDIPLLVETGQQKRFDVLVVVQAPESERLRRMTEDRGMRRREAQLRIRAQTTDEERAAAADVVLDNSGTLEELYAQTDRLWEQLRTRIR
nr:dephospho-CoA kinase [Nesterenkonia sphaerica]